jgi:hypothetical protein
VFFGMNTAPCPVAAVDIDFKATAAKYAASTSASPGAGASSIGESLVEVGSVLVVKDQEDYARYVQWQRDYARRGWEWHLFSTEFLFAMVMAIVAFGLWLTHKQFQRDYLPRRVAPAPADGSQPAPATADGPAPSTFKLGPAGLELTSQVVGLLVLAISVAFFYFYVKEVYPMREIDRDTAALTSSVEKPTK